MRCFFLLVCVFVGRLGARRPIATEHSHAGGAHERVGAEREARGGYDALERKLKEVFTERTGTLRQLSRTSKELDSIKGNLQSLKNDVPKEDVQRILELSHKQREELQSLQATLQKQLDEAAEKAERQQATIKFLKMEMEQKTKIIKALQQENKSLKNKLLSGSKLCDIHAEESKRIQAQLKELRYGKKDLIFKGQQLMDLENKLRIAKEDLEKAALDKESQLKALKDAVHICFSSVLHNPSMGVHRLPATPTQAMRYSALANHSRVTFQQPHAKDLPKVARVSVPSGSPEGLGARRGAAAGVGDCQRLKVSDCFQNQTERISTELQQRNRHNQQRIQEPPGKDSDRTAEDSMKTESSLNKTHPDKPN